MKRLLGFITFVRYVIARAGEDRLTQVASSLTFTTLLSLVPLITIGMASIAGFPAFSSIATDFKIFLLTHMVPEVAGKVITVYMEQFADAAGQLTALGIAFLAVTAMLLMLTIDNALNAIWHVTRPRPLVQRLLVYWAALTLGPALLGGSLSLTSWLISSSLGLTLEVPVLREVLFKLASLALSAAAFSLLFVTVPNRHVPWRHALTGGLASAVAFEAMQRGFGFYITHFPAQKLIYGAFASIPIFLMWIYLSWLVILLGAVVAASLTSWHGRGIWHEPIPGEHFEQALEVMRALFESLRGAEVVTVPGLSRRMRLGYEELEDILDQLVRAHWVRKIAGEGWVLARDPEQIRVAEIYRMFVFRQPSRRVKPADERADALLGELHSKVDAELDLSLKQLFTEPRAVEIKRAR